MTGTSTSKQRLLKEALSTKSLTFTEFFVALAWAMENIQITIPEEERPLLEKGRIMSVFLPPAWDLGPEWSQRYSGSDNLQRGRAAELVNFLYLSFFCLGKIVDPDTLRDVSDLFEVCSVPPAHILLLDDSKAKAKDLYRRDPEPIRIAVGEILRRYLEHREANRESSGEMRCFGFGLALQLKVAD